VRIIRRRIQGNVQVVEYAPTRVRSLVIDDTGVVGIDDTYLDGGRYASSVAVFADAWSFRSFAYDGDRFVSVWTAVAAVGHGCRRGHRRHRCRAHG
jgi:hypothetical protein